MKCLRSCFCWYLLYLATAASVELGSALGTMARSLPVRHGWAIPRGGSKETQPSTENNSDGEMADSDDEWEEKEEMVQDEARQTDAWSEAVDSGSDLEQDDRGRETDIAGDDDIDMFLDAQELIEDESAAEEIAQDGLLDEKEEEEEGDEGDEEFEEKIGEGVTPETDFETQELQQEVSTSTEDASQIEPEFSGENESEAGVIAAEAVAEATGSYAEEEEAVEFVGPSVRDTCQETAAAVTMAEAETTEEEAAFVAASQAAEDIRVEIDLSQQHTTDDDSMAFEDRMQLADDEGEAALGGFPEEEILEAADGSIVDESVVADDGPANAEAAADYDQDTTPSEDANVEKGSCAVLDDETKRILIKELKFHRREVNGMKPEIAVILAEKRLRRPFEGIPPNWYTDEAQYKQSAETTRLKNRILKVALLPIVYAVPIVLGSLAIYGSADLASMLSTLSSNSPDKSDDQEELVPTPEADENENLSRPSSTSTGCIAPYADTAIPKKEDDTWLDKVITGVAEPLKAFWYMEI